MKDIVSKLSIVADIEDSSCETSVKRERVRK